MKIALVHDWLNSLGGAERVLIELHNIFPEAPIYTLFANSKFTRQFLPDATIITSSLQKIPFITRIYPYLFFLMPSMMESFDFNDYDLVISSSVTFSKSIILKPKTKHICYCYSPTRFLWDRNADSRRTGWLTRIPKHFLRLWDRQAAERVDQFVAISKNIQQRIKKYYQRDSIVIYPPITLNQSVRRGMPERYYLIVSRLYDYKNIHVAIETFNKLGFPLLIVGSGPARARLERMAKSNIKFLGHKSDEQLAELYQNCHAFIMPQEEDFGLTALEAMSFGKPVLALRRGGALETIIEGVTGEFFDDPIPEALADGLRRLNENYPRYNSTTIQSHARSFSQEKFKQAILNLINNETISYHD